jgi:hypothetical protein
VTLTVAVVVEVFTRRSTRSVVASFAPEVTTKVPSVADLRPFDGAVHCEVCVELRATALIAERLSRVAAARICKPETAAVAAAATVAVPSMLKVVPLRLVIVYGPAARPPPIKVACAAVICTVDPDAGAAVTVNVIGALSVTLVNALAETTVVAGALLFKVSNLVVAVVSSTRNFTLPTFAMVDAILAFRSNGASEGTAYAVPESGARDTKVLSARPAADAGATAETARATNAPNAAPLRVRFLDMYVSFFSWFIS